MRIRPRTVIGALLLAGLILGVILVIYAFGTGSFRSGVRIGYVGSESRSSWSGQYLSLDGTMRRKLYPKTDCLHIEVETESGSLSIQMKDSLGRIIFDEDGIGTERFDVPVSGKVSIVLKADSHRGGFRIGSEKS